MWIVISYSVLPSATGTTDVMNLPRAPPGSPRKEHCINPPSRTRQTEEAFDETKIYHNEDLVTLESHYSGRGLFMARVETIAPDNRESDWEYDCAKDRHRLAVHHTRRTGHRGAWTEVRGDKECAPNQIAPVNLSHEVVVFSAKTGFGLTPSKA